MMKHPIRIAAALATVAAAACSDSQPAHLSALAQRGRHTYENVCIACHNGDPNLAGSMGPPIAGSSRELVAAKVLHGQYPPGYTPKRPTAQMPRLGYLAPEIDAIAAYLAEAKAPQAESGSGVRSAPPS
jgi:mono/diheme cytochrome c family protein